MLEILWRQPCDPPHRPTPGPRPALLALIGTRRAFHLYTPYLAITGVLKILELQPVRVLNGQEICPRLGALLERSTNEILSGTDGRFGRRGGTGGGSRAEEDHESPIRAQGFALHSVASAARRTGGTGRSGNGTAGSVI